MPYTPTTASVRDDAHTSDGPPMALVLSVAASLVSLLAVVAGFALVAASLMGVETVSLGWGAGLCVGGWALAAAVRERVGGLISRGETDLPSQDTPWPVAHEAS